MGEDHTNTPRYGILGPLAVIGGSGPVRLGGRLQRLLLAVLLVEVNRTMSVDRLADELWGDRLPDDPAGALRTQVSRLRRSLPDGTSLVTDEAGYRLIADRNEVDAGQFEQLIAAASETRGEHALRFLDGALQLWRGEPLDEFVDRPFAQVEARRLDELHRAARERRASLLLALGRSTEAAAEANALLAVQPERERARAVLMEALYQQGRHTDALDIYQTWRRQLAEEHGLEPSPALRELEQRVLLHAVVDSDSPPGETTPVVPRPVTSFIGRDTDLRGVADLLDRARLVTLWGPGGVGKTRLALEAVKRITCSGKVLVLIGLVR